MTSTGIPNRPSAIFNQSVRLLTGKLALQKMDHGTITAAAAALISIGTVEYRQTRHGTPVCKYRGGPLPQQDEIFATEAELNRRYQAGDKSAALIRPIPGTAHI